MSDHSTKKRRLHVATIQLTERQVGFAMVNGMTKEEMVEKAVAEYCATPASGLASVASHAVTNITSPCG